MISLERLAVHDAPLGFPLGTTQLLATEDYAEAAYNGLHGTSNTVAFTHTQIKLRHTGFLKLVQVSVLPPRRSHRHVNHKVTSTHAKRSQAPAKVQIPRKRKRATIELVTRVAYFG
jgi:hypothetical protein